MVPGDVMVKFEGYEVPKGVWLGVFDVVLRRGGCRVYIDDL